MKREGEQTLLRVFLRSTDHYSWWSGAADTLLGRAMKRGLVGATELEGFLGGLTAIHVLEHLADSVVAEALACWRRVLRPGGRALVVVPDPAGRGRELSGPRWMGFQDETHINLKPHEFLREPAHAVDVSLSPTVFND